MASRSAAISSLVLLMWGPCVAGGCGEREQGPTGAVCTDPLTGACVACPGSPACVDPQTCAFVTCGGADILFGGQDAGTADAGTGAPLIDGGADGADKDGGPADGADKDGSADDDAGDVAPGDAAAGDDDAGDAAAPDAGQSDAGPLDAGVAGCGAGAKTCLGAKTPAFCFDGHWLELAQCKSGLVCEKGECVCADECVAINQVQCLDKIAALKTCQLVDGCLSWTVPLACKPGEVCQAGQCKAPTPGSCNPPCPAGQACQSGVCVVSGCNPPCGLGQHCEQNKCVADKIGTLACGQIFACVDQFANGPNDKVNIDACVAKGTAQAQALYAKRKACIALSCQTYIDQGKGNEAMLCLYTYCASEQTACLGSGGDDCQQLAGCIVGCSGSSLCLVSCHSGASVKGAKDFYALQACASNQCPGLTGAAWSQCAGQKCKAFLDKCTGGSLSCAQILQCAKGCTTKPCAQACKAKGSVQGLSDLQKLLACSDAKCGTYCQSGTQAQCDVCLDVLCKAENNACK